MKAIVAAGFGKLHFHETARALAQAGVDVDFLTGWLPRERQAAAVDWLGQLIGERHLARRMAARRVDVPGVTVTPIAWAEVAGTLMTLAQRGRLLPQNSATGAKFRLAAWASRKYLRNADVLLMRSGAGQCGAIATARRNGLAVVTDQSIAHPAFIHEILHEEFQPFATGYDPKIILWKLVLQDCDDADLLLVNSDFVKETFLARGYPADRIRVAYLGVREFFFDLKRHYKIDGPTKLLFTGNFDLRKGVRVLLEAVRKCRQGGLDLRLKLIGNLSNGRPCLLPSDSEFFTHIPFVPQAELGAALADADMFVLPTFAEGSSRSAMEAAAAGLPVITTKNCGLPLQDGVSAVYVPINDADRLANAISRVASDEVLRESLARNAVKTITGQYTWRHYGERVRNVLSEAIRLAGHGERSMSIAGS